MRLPIQSRIVTKGRNAECRTSSSRWSQKRTDDLGRAPNRVVELRRVRYPRLRHVRFPAPPSTGDRGDRTHERVGSHSTVAEVVGDDYEERRLAVGECRTEDTNA